MQELVLDHLFDVCGQGQRRGHRLAVWPRYPGGKRDPALGPARSGPGGGDQRPLGSLCRAGRRPGHDGG